MVPVLAIDIVQNIILYPDCIRRVVRTVVEGNNKSRFFTPSRRRRSRSGRG